MISYTGSSSRRVKREKKQVISQSIALIGLAVALLIAFIFVIIPHFFNFVTNVLDSSNPFQEVDTTAPQIPIISAPLSATNSAQLSITGFGEPESFVIIVHNGAQKSPEKINADGWFSADVTLETGENKLSAFSKDAAENESAVTREYTTVFDNSAPTIESLSPETGSSFESRDKQTITISGTVVDTDSETKVYINDRLVFPKEEGKFSYSYRLNEGENKVLIKAIDKAGNSNEVEVVYSFSF